MKATKALATTDTRFNPFGLSLAQQSAVDLLAAGHNDTETAAALKLHRVTVTRWRLYSPEFRAALAEQRAAIWGAAAVRLRALVPKALDAIAEALERADNPDRATVALALLKLAGTPAVPLGSTDPEEVIWQVVERERERLRNRVRSCDDLMGLPDHDQHLKTVRKRLARLAPPDALSMEETNGVASLAPVPSGPGDEV